MDGWINNGCNQVKIDHLCLGCRPYSRWSYFWFSALSTAQLLTALGRSLRRMLLNLVIAVMSRG